MGLLSSSRLLWSPGDASLYPRGPFVQITSGKDVACGVEETGLVHCWGKDKHGQLDAPQDVQFRQVSCGSSEHCCGVTLANDVRCWGMNGNGQSEGRRGDYRQVSAGHKFTCALGADGAIE